MTQSDDTTPLTFLTFLSATEHDILPMDRPTLLGTFSSPDGAKALVRLSSGDVQELRPHDHLGQAEVVSIGDGHLDLSLMGEIHRLRIPDNTPNK